ncbi:hypothetical protein AT575_07560 [Streptococcus penaeicida]|uniref:Uncharacterized protein n=1 Tax=Streptococcus penaeicida TaxID=1765960 RepID=A0A2N8LB22_9STRE|nr:hypothetical protein [Streptococcus penaeicida]PND47361.1 hypothetical protein AT575_07560 [Streptococcus penaeicida]
MDNIGYLYLSIVLLILLLLENRSRKKIAKKLTGLLIEKKIPLLEIRKSIHTEVDIIKEINSIYGIGIKNAKEVYDCLYK